ncbi:LOW QUALITY PROTEIN: charged multivesicular body protein 4b-like [Neomonachus schauinslandi]|uniref:LOW QUALITY PROTEIN: charged multivesicular body protein 4b-like n=1 Tax=Neomonachus schauinslandi TaxID=29088 RepID=A0A8M1M3J5_NEOSC|nr:LOW QUALITY PROTEIN: charged multivesicular body protein 4b-like [Neomonachus schauinslandi]
MNQSRTGFSTLAKSWGTFRNPKAQSCGAEAAERPAAGSGGPGAGAGAEPSRSGRRRPARRAATVSVFGKLFGAGGGKAGKGGPTPQDAIQRLRDTEEMLSKKQEFLETKMEQELTAAKKHGTQNKRAALQALKHKKRYEKQLAQIDGTLSTIEFQREALENTNTNTEVLKNMGYAAKAYDTDIDEVDELMQDIADQQELAEEISTAISKPVGFGEEFDEDELMAELEELEQEELDKNLLEISGPETVPLPNVPSITLPSKPTKKKEKEEDDMKELENWAGSM